MCAILHVDPAHVCADQLPSSEIWVTTTAQGKTAQLVRNQCAAIVPPQTLNMSDLVFATDGSGDISYQGVQYVPTAAPAASPTPSPAPSPAPTGAPAAITLPDGHSYNTLAFDEEFDGPSLDTTRWHTHYENGDRTLASNNEAEYYADPGQCGINPFSVAGGVLTIEARPLTVAQAGCLGISSTGAVQYSSGLLNSAPSFNAAYGYWEIRAQMPAGNGLWPSFWSLPSAQPYHWPPAMNVFQAFGSKPNQTYWTSVYTGSTGAVEDGTWVTLPFSTQTGMHVYGMEWTAQNLTWFVDGQQIAQDTTKPDQNEAMYLILDLAVGGAGSKPGMPDASTVFPARLMVDYIRAYR